MSELDIKIGEIEVKYRQKFDTMTTQINKLHVMLKNLILYSQDSGMRTSLVIECLAKEGLITEEEFNAKMEAIVAKMLEEKKKEDNNLSPTLKDNSQVHDLSKVTPNKGQVVAQMQADSMRDQMR